MEMVETLQALQKRAVIGFLGGSDLNKITEQLSYHGGPGPHMLHLTALVLTFPINSDW
jgi:hypothetical protein